jgi:molecular chaperone HscA
MAQLRQAMAAADANAATIEAATEALAKGTEAFAAERMNQNIQKALAGKSIQSL